MDMVKFSKVKQQCPCVYLNVAVHDDYTGELFCYALFSKCKISISGISPFLYISYVFLQSPLQESLIDFSDSGMNRVAADIFLGEKDEWSDGYRSL